MRTDGKYVKFTPEEDELLKQHYFSMGGAAMIRNDLLNRSISQISSRANHIGLSFDPSRIGLHARNKEDLTHLIDIKDPFVAYMLGFLWADGTVSKRSFNVKLKISDIDFQDIKDRWLSTARSWNYNLYDDDNPKHAISAIVTINHVDFHNFLVQHDYLFKSGYSADRILAACPDLLRHYWWRGYFDGDGGFTESGETRRISLSSGYEQDWSFFIVLAQQLDLVYSIRRYRDKAGHSYVIIDNEANLRRFMDYIYTGESFGLTRKYQSYLRYKEYKKTCRPNKTSVYRGVFHRKDSLSMGWIMSIYDGSVKKCVRKSFNTEEEAAREYDRLATILFGRNAVLNFP